jgi:glycerophosphoryl diester phosphodiesterase
MQSLILAVVAVAVGPASLAEVMQPRSIQLGPRPFYLVDQLEDGPLKRELSDCAARIDEYRVSSFSIGHRGAPLQFPEHTPESYLAAARMGAGILECDVSFTRDGVLVCRHALCDLHTTTNILGTPLASKCTQGFEPAEFDADGNRSKAASALCCASDLTVAEFQTLKGRMGSADPNATTVEAYLGGIGDSRTGLYAGAWGQSLMTHREAIALFRALGRGMTPELKGGDDRATYGVADVFGSQGAYAQALIDDYRFEGISPDSVWIQSFNLDDVLYWVENAPLYGRQAVFLDGRDPAALADEPPREQEFLDLKAMGISIIAPPMPTLLTVTHGEIVPSEYARRARKAGLDILSWTTERSGRLGPGGGGFYYSTVTDALKNDGDILQVIDVLVKDVGIIGLFSDWPATTTFYANCKAIPALEERRRAKIQKTDARP